MKNIHFINIIFTVSVMIITNLNLIVAQDSYSLDCFTIIVGKNATSDGSVIVSHNEDDNGTQIVNLYRTSEKKHKINEVIKFENGGTINQIEKTNGFIWIELPGMKVSDGYVNDYGVVVFSNGCPSREDKPDSTDGGILYWLRRIVAERAQSAKEGVKIAGNLIDKYGYVSSGRTYTIADKNEAWVLSAVYGKHWIAQRVPDDEIAVIPNYYTIGKVNLEDTLNFLGASDIITYAEKKGWFIPDENNEFNFAKSYTALTSLNHPGNINRIWRGIKLLSNQDYKIDQEFPFSFKPYKKIDIENVMDILSDHYENCELDKSDMYKNGNPHKINNATICSETTQYSIIVQLRQNMPTEIGTLVWLTYFRPCVNLYAPIYLGIKNFPEGFAYTNSEEAIKLHFNPDEEIFKKNSFHVYWDFIAANDFVNQDFYSIYPKIKNQNNYLQNEFIRNTKIFENNVLKLYSENSKSALNQIDNYSKNKLNEILNYAKNLLK